MHTVEIRLFKLNVFGDFLSWHFKVNSMTFFISFHFQFFYFFSLSSQMMKKSDCQNNVPVLIKICFPFSWKNKTFLPFQFQSLALRVGCISPFFFFEGGFRSRHLDWIIIIKEAGEREMWKKQAIKCLLITNEININYNFLYINKYLIHNLNQKN